MQPIKSISIPQPCHENWNKMSPVDQGRYCTQCSKTVTDFTAMTNTQIINYFARQGNVCGRFGETQLTGLNNYLAVEEKPRFSWKKVAIAAAVTSVFATANANAQRTVGKVKVSQSVNDTKKADNSILFADTALRTIRGLITSSDDGLPLPGASVKVLNSDISTFTGVNGEYKIEVPGNKDTLEVTFIGFTPQKMRLDKIRTTTCNASLITSNVALMGVVAGGVFVKRQPFYTKIWHGITHFFSK